MAKNDAEILRVECADNGEVTIHRQVRKDGEIFARRDVMKPGEAIQLDIGPKGQIVQWSLEFGRADTATLSAGTP